MSVPFKPSFPWLLYSYPWMPFPRRIALYLREKRISESLVKIVQVSDPGDGNKVMDAQSFPPRPPGSLPILAIPAYDKGSDGKAKEWLYIRQSMAIINFLEELCEKREYGFSSPHGPLTGNTPLERARNTEIQGLAEELTVGWNPVRSFGTNAGPFHNSAASKEMLRWERRALLAINTYMEEADRDLSLLKDDNRPVTIADIVLYQFLEFTLDCYRVDMTNGTGEKVTDVYGREVKDAYPKVKEFFEAFRTRASARRVEKEGENPPEKALKAMTTWVEGVL